MSPAPMQYVKLGKSGLKVSRLILGTLQYGSKQSWMVSDHDAAVAQIKHAYDLGINTFDTSGSYSNGEAETILGEFLQRHAIPRDDVVILSKVFYPSSADAGANSRGLSRKNIFASVKQSLARLQLDHLDVLQCHRFDAETPVEETMRALHDLVTLGLVRYIGMSSCMAWQFQVMQQYALHNGLTPFISMQNEHNALFREEEREMIPTLDYFGVGMIPYGALGHGLLCRPFESALSGERKDILIAQGRAPDADVDRPIIDAVQQVARARGVAMAQIALAWSLSAAQVTAPIVGTTSAARLDELVGALDIDLTPEEKSMIGGLYRPKELHIHI